MEKRKTILRGSLFNISSGMTIRIGDMLTAWAAEVTVAGVIAPEPIRRPLTDIAGGSRDFFKTGRATGWKPVITCAEKWLHVLDDCQGNATRLTPAGARLP